VYLNEFNEAPCIVSLQNVVSENCVLRYYAEGSDNFLPMFRDNLSVPFSGFKNPDVILDATDRLSRSVGKKLPLLA